jgi:prepilin-type N-terminal cleavage/methylation domain-containing protein
LTLSRDIRRSDGFSLLEVLVALAILSVGLVAVVQLFSQSLRSTKKSENYSLALVYASSLLEEAYAVPDIEDLEGTFDLGEGFSARRTFTPAGTLEGGEQRQGRSLGESAPVVMRLYEVRVTVSWPPAGRLELAGKKAVHEEE